MSPDRSKKLYSCVLCFERKVKCDKQHPCSSCVRSKVECIFRVPSAPRRKKKRPQDEVLSSDQNETPQKVSSSSTSQRIIIQPHQGSFSRGNLIMDLGKTRYFENNLWSSVSEELQQPREALADSSSEDNSETVVEENTDFVLGLTTSSYQRQDHHPPPDQILKLWQLFLENVDPMTKMIHRPTLHEKILKASTDLESINKGLEALMFSIYSSALHSITDRQCEMSFGEPRRAMLLKYRRCTRMALSRAHFLGTSDIVVLQAFMLYLLIMREDYDARTLWTLVGVASRIAQGLGIHRDGSSMGLQPFETEMRRRLWWQITMLDFRSAELTGSARYGDFSLSNTIPPTNVNDEDIWPDMKEPPLGQIRPTEITACLIRCEFGNFWKEKLSQKGINEADYGATVGFVSSIKTPWESSLEERDKYIDELERRLEDKFLRYCDTSIPIQFMTSLIGRGAVASLRLIAHHPKHYENDSSIPTQEKRLLWNLSMKLLESDNIAHSSRTLQKFIWHTKVYFQWHALIYVLGELKKQPLGEEAENGWTQVDQIFQHHPNFITESKKPLHVAVGSLCIKAYDARERALDKSGGFRPARVPDFIMQLLEQRRKARTNFQPQTGVPQPDLAQEVPFGVTKQPNFKEVQRVQQQQQSEQNYHQTYTPQQQQPLPPLTPGQTPVPDSQNTYLLGSFFDPTFSPDFINNDAQIDWTHWDNLIRDIDMVD